jgi:hypothetical protein
MPPYKQGGAFQRWAAVSHRLRSPFCSDNGELPLPKPLRSAILTPPPDIWRMSGQLRAIFTTIGIGSVEVLRLEGLSRGPEAVARALDHASNWMERRRPELIGRR